MYVASGVFCCLQSSCMEHFNETKSSSSIILYYEYYILYPNQPAILNVPLAESSEIILCKGSHL